MLNKLSKIKYTLLTAFFAVVLLAVYPNAALSHDPAAPSIQAMLNLPSAPAPTQLFSRNMLVYRRPLTVKLPILMYHHITENGDPESTITPKRFEEHIALLLENGYTPVSMEQLIGYVESRSLLPEKPICITFDDGYYSNYEIAFPILKKYNAKATIFVIGSSVGSKSTYKDTGFPITPHFDYTEAAEMIDSGLISIQSHTYDMHQNFSYDGTNARINVAPLEGEASSTYAQRFMADFAKIKSAVFENLGTSINTVAYPKGQFDYISESVLTRMGVKVTLSTRKGINTLIQGDSSCLRKMYRYNVERNVTAPALLKMLYSIEDT